MDDLLALEQSVETLLQHVHKLRSENSALKSRLDDLLHDKSDLMKKNDQARSRLESMISRLKSLEQIA